MTREEIKEIRERVQAIKGYNIKNMWEWWEAKKALTEHACEDIPALLDEVEALNNYVEGYKNICKKHVETHQLLIGEIKKLQAENASLRRERDKAVEDMKIMADCMRNNEGTEESCCFACKYDPSNTDYIGECPGYETDECFEWRGTEGEK